VPPKNAQSRTRAILQGTRRRDVVHPFASHHHQISRRSIYQTVFLCLPAPILARLVTRLRSRYFGSPTRPRRGIVPPATSPKSTRRRLFFLRHRVLRRALSPSSPDSGGEHRITSSTPHTCSSFAGQHHPFSRQRHGDAIRSADRRAHKRFSEPGNPACRT